MVKTSIQNDVKLPKKKIPENGILAMQSSSVLRIFFFVLFFGPSHLFVLLFFSLSLVCMCIKRIDNAFVPCVSVSVFWYAIRRLHSGGIFNSKHYFLPANNCVCVFCIYVTLTHIPVPENTNVSIQCCAHAAHLSRSDLFYCFVERSFVLTLWFLCPF